VQRANRVATIAAASAFLSLTFIDETGVAVTLPRLQAELGLSTLAGQWVMNSFFLALSVFVLVSGQLGDRLGHRRIFLVGLGVFLAASIGCAMAPGGTVLIIARTIQGLGASLMLATYALLIGRVFPPEEQGMALGTSASIASVFLAVGPLIGGFFTDTIGWQWIFWINLPIGLLTWLAVVRAIPADQPTSVKHRIDSLGFLTFTVGFGALILVLMQAVEWGWTSHLAIVCGTVALCGLVAFARVEHTAVPPLADLRLFAQRQFLGGNIVLLTAQVCVMAVNFWALWLQVALDFSPLIAGLLLLPAGIPILFVARFGGQWADRAGTYAPIRVGSVLVLASMTWMALTIEQQSYLFAMVGMVLYGVGAPLMISPAIKTVLFSVEMERGGMASGILNTMRQLGAALAFGVIGAIVNAVERSGVALLDVGTEVGAKMPDAAAIISWAAQNPDHPMAANLRVSASVVNSTAMSYGMWAAVGFAALGCLSAMLLLGPKVTAAEPVEVVDEAAEAVKSTAL
jgi:EmrB/QacA subfamily drug resistance transporter